MLSLLSAMLCCVAVSAQHKVEMIPFGNMDQWIDRQIKESGIIGGATKNVYAIGPTATIRENKPYKNMGGSPWATSNVMARVAGITKTNTSVFPEKRGDGFCARMDTRMESVKVFGIVDITVLAAGSIFLGDVHEPIRNEPLFAETLGRQRRKYLCQTRGYGGGALLHYNGRLAQQCHLFHYVRRYNGQPRIQGAHDAPASAGTLCGEQ